MEEAVKFGINKGLIGVITQPTLGTDHKLPAIIMLNAGLIHKIGPNRLHVKMARAFEQLGFTSLRFDLSGIGDSKNSTQDLDFKSNGVQNVKEAMDFLAANKGVQRFIIMGICSGSDIAFRAAIEDERIIATVPINGYYFDMLGADPIFNIASKACTMRYYKKNALNASRWIKILSGQSKVFSKKNALAFYSLVSKAVLKRINRPKKSSSPAHKAEHVDRYPITNWEKLMDRKVAMLHIFSEGSVAYDVYNITVAKKLKGFIQKGLLDYEFLNNVDHIFTPDWSQERLVSILTNWLSSKREQGVLTISEHPDNPENKNIEDLLMLNI